jgi:hypothetical protein
MSAAHLLDKQIGAIVDRAWLRMCEVDPALP